MTELFGGRKLIRIPGVPGTCYTEGFGECRVVVSQDPLTIRGVVRTRWHMSISHPTRYPTWDEVKQARYKHCPKDIYMVMVLPPAEAYTDFHKNCFQLIEVDNADVGAEM